MAPLYGYIHNEHDAYLIVHAIRFDLVQPVESRLNRVERTKINSGDIFIFIERKDGMKRWTDGLNWTPSRVKGQFLIYKEIPQVYNISKQAHNTSNYGPHDFTLYKKTISITLDFINYHIVSYFRPIFSKKSLFTIPFFNAINSAIVENNRLLDNFFVKSELLNGKELFLKKFNLETYSKKNNYRVINRAVEVETIDILMDFVKGR